MSFPVWITQEGLNRAGNANGPQIEIDAIGIGTAFGDRGYTPHRNQTALQNEVMRVSISSAINRGDGYWQITAPTNESKEYAVREVGYYLTDGTLFAIWSHPTNVWFYQTLVNKPIQAFDLMLKDVPPDSVTVIEAGGLQLFFDREFYQMTIASTQMATAQMDVMLQQLGLDKRLKTLEAKQ